MDILKSPSTSPIQKLKRHVFIVVSAVLLISLLIVMVSMDFKTPRVDKEKIRIGIVKNGTFEIIVGANGKLISEEIEWIASQVDGNVAKIYARPGDYVKKNQIVVTLANPIINNIASAAAIELSGAKAAFEAKKVEIETGILDQEAQYS
ncbi:MAG: efflux RND transporter periplasmic adaptor subunit, partial [Moraxellaceae bacterium]